MRFVVLVVPVVAVIAFLLATAKDETPPHWKDVCEKTEISHYQTIFMWTGKAMIPLVTPIYKCVRTERQCVVGDDFTGERKCVP